MTRQTMGIHKMGAQPKDALRQAIEELRRTHAGYSDGHEREWTEAVRHALTHVVHGLQKGVAANYAPEGPLTPVDPTWPTMAREAKALSEDEGRELQHAVELHEKMREAADDLAEKGGVGNPPDKNAQGKVESLYQEVKEFLAELQHIKETESRLVVESVNVDIGGEAGA